MLVGSQIGPFHIEKELGSGAMGTVYKAKFEKEPGKVIPVALKVVSIGLLGNESAMARFDREASILKQLKHPHIVRLLAVGKYRQTPFIAMEFVDGESLDRVLARRMKLAWEEVIPYAKQLCEALQHAHDKGIVHRDLKPSNLMVDKNGTLKLTDFGIAKDTDVTALTGANSTIGTAAYMSPEQCRGDKTLGPKSDLYSLGVCLYELITGKKPFIAESTIEMFTKHVSEVPTRPRKLEPDLPVWLDNLIMFCLEKNKESRPLDAATVGRMLSEIEEKVQSQQSVGEEVAKARRIDRQVGGAPLDEVDKEAARRLRGRKPKKKKSKPLWQRTWFRMLFPLLGLFLVVAIAGYALRDLFRTEPIDQLAEKVETAGNRAEAATDFLRLYNDRTDPAVEKVRAIFREEKAKEAEKGLVARFNSKMRNNSDNYDETTYPQAIAALEAEKAGDLKQAAELWTLVRDKSPQEDTSKLATDEEVFRVKLRWVAEKRLSELRTAPEILQKLIAQHEQDRLIQFERIFEPNAIEALALKAHRLERLKDFSKAKRAWSVVLAEAESRNEQRVWYLIASEKVAQLKNEQSKAEDVEQRIQLLTGLLAKLRSEAENLEYAAVPGVVKRDIRNACRDVIACYSDEQEDPFPSYVKQAKELLASLAH